MCLWREIGEMIDVETIDVGKGDIGAIREHSLSRQRTWHY